MRRAVFSVLVLLAVLCLGGCRRHRATPEECHDILQRIIELELRELHFRDPALVQRKTAEVERTLGPDLRRCPGVRVRDDAMACVRRAASVEELSHRCLR